MLDVLRALVRRRRTSTPETNEADEDVRDEVDPEPFSEA